MVRRDSFQNGFSLALGAVVLLILMYLGWQFLQAVMAIASPFIAAIIISLLLDPMVVRIQKRFASNDRNKAVLIVFGMFLVCFLGLVAFLIPNLITQTSHLVTFFTPVSYKIERAPADGGRWFTVEESVSSTNYTIRNLTNDRDYQFRVTAKDPQEEGHIQVLPVVAATPKKPSGENKTDNTTPAPSPSPSPSPTSGPTEPSVPVLDNPPAAPFPATPSPTSEPKTGPPPQEISQAPDPARGTLIASPGDGEVRLTWTPPPAFESKIDQLRANGDRWLRENRKIGPFALPESIEKLQTQYSEQISRALQQSATRLANIVTDSASKLLTVVLIPILTFYILADMSKLRARFLYILPEKTRAHFMRIANDVGGTFSNYLRGMLTLSALYGVVAMALYFGFRLNAYALLLGFIAGLFYSVPFVGPAITLSLVAVISLAAGLPMVNIGVLLVVSFIQNMIFDNFITPRVVGKSVGLHPITTIFSLFLGGQLFGLLGMLFAVPLAASIQISLQRLFPKLGEPVPLSILLQGPEAEEDKQEMQAVAQLAEGESETPPVEQATSRPTTIVSMLPTETPATPPDATETPGKSPYSMD